MDWISKSRKLLALVSLLFIAASCTISYKFNGASINYDKVKTISIANFPIKSAYVYAPLGTVFNDQLQNMFVRQTRLQLVTRNGDLNLEGEITNYQQINEGVQADGYSSTVKLSVTVNVRFTNNSNHAEDFEQQFTAFQNYPSNEQLNAVQDGLIEKMVKDITEQIFNAAVANW